MPFSQVQITKSVLVLMTAMSLLWSPCAQATNSLNNQTIQLDKPAYFTTLAGDSIQLQSGSYELASLPDSLQVTPTAGAASVQLAMTLNTHDQKLSEPTAVSVEGKPEGESVDRHVLALYLPGGFSYTAEGTYSGIQSRAVNPQAVITDPGQIHLEKPVHFLGFEGQDHVAKPGRYTVEQADQNIRLVPGEGHEALLIEAQEETHDSGLAIPIALSLPGAAEEEADLHHVVLLLPGGKSLEAIGTYSGIQQRGLFDKAAKRLKKGVNKATKPVRKTVNRAKNTVKRVGHQVTKSPPSFQTLKGTGRVLGNAAKNTAKDSAKFAKKAALEAKKKAEWTAKQAVKGVQWLGQQACKVALQAVDVSLKVAGKALGPVQKKLAKELMRPEIKKKLAQAVNAALKQAGPAIKKGLEAGAIINDPRNVRVLKGLLKKDKMCEKSPSEMLKPIEKMVRKPMREALAVYKKGKNSQVRSRGVDRSKGPSGTFAIGGGGGAGAGLEMGIRLASDFGNKKDQAFFDIAGKLATAYGGAGGVIIGLFPYKDPKDTGGNFFSIGVAAGGPLGKELFAKMAPGVGGGVDLIFDFPWEWKGNVFDDHFQGFAFSIGTGVAKSTPVEVGVQFGTGIPL